MNNINIKNPWLLFLILPLVVLSVVGFFLIPKGRRKTPRNVISFVLHLVMSVVLGLSFADIRFLKASSKSELYVVADLSDSSKENIAKIDGLIKDIQNQTKNQDTKVGVVGFAKDPVLLVKAGGSFTSVEDSLKKVDGFDASATNLESAITYTDSLYSSDVLKRMVIVSDGMETDGKAVRTVDQLLQDNVEVNAISLSAPSSDEVAVTGIDTNTNCFVNKENNVKVSIQSRHGGHAKVELMANAETKDSVSTDLSSGVNIVNFTTKSDKAGTVEYQVKVTPDEESADTYAENNVMSFEQTYSDKMKILFIGALDTDLENFKALNLYGENTEIVPYVDTTTVPYKLEDLVQYDEIILSDVDLMTLDHYEEFVTSLITAVKVYGKTLETFGSTYTGLSANESVKSYNDILPIQHEGSGTKSIILLIDNSASMSTDNRLSMAKKGAIAILDRLGEDDKVGVLTFSDEVTIVQALTSVKYKDSIIKNINKIELGGGTSMLPGLKQAQKQLLGADSEFKNVLVLSDGEPFESESDLKKQVIKMSAENIASSFINISNATGSSLLKHLAKVGNGTYYYCRNANSLVNVMLTSVAGDIANTKIEKDTEININAASDPSVASLRGFPNISGYNFGHVRSAATTVLTVQYENDTTTVSEEGGTEQGIGITVVPLYAYWSFGEGQVSSFTSSLDDWTSSFRASENGQKFFKQASDEMAPSKSNKDLLSVSYDRNGVTTDVHVASNNGDATARVFIQVTSPDQSEAKYELPYDGEAYSVTVATPVKGEYKIHISYSENYGTSEEPNYVETQTKDAPLFFDYSKEYDNFSTSQNTTLATLVKKMKGKLTHEKADESLSDESVSVTTYVSTMFFFLILAVVLYLVDIFVRKSEFKKRKASPSTPAPSARA